MVVQHNLTAMNSNRMLGLTTKAQAKSTEKLSSGYKINRAADDAAGLAISEKMRRQVRGLTQAGANAQDGISAVQTAEGALTEVHDMLQRLNELATKSANGTNSQEERDYIQSEADALINEIDRVSETTKFNEIYLLKGAQDKVSMKKETIEAMAGGIGIKDTAPGLAYAADSTEAVTADTAATPAANASMEINSAALGGKVLVAKTTADGIANFVQVTADNLSTYCAVADDGTVSVKTGYDVATAASLADAKAGSNGGHTAVADIKTVVTGHAKTDAADATDGTLSQYVEVAEDGSLKYKDGAMLYKVPGVDNTPFGAQVTDKQIAEADLGNYFEEKGDFIYTDDAGTTALAEDADLSSYFDEYGVYKGGLYKKDGADIKEIGADQIFDYFDKKNAAGPAGPALKFNLHVGSESDMKNVITVEIKPMSAAGIGIDGLRDNKGLSKEQDARDSIETIKEAIKQVSQQRSELGAVQNRLEHTINNLDNVVENTTAAESAIRDTDMATEMVRYANNNILAQAGQAMLAQSNQANQGVLSLLG